jgi:iron complex transport system ATP-binding protein
MSHIITMEDVSWRRNGKAIIKEINWKVAPGEHWALLGLNGSGKTTILNMLNGYIWPTTGKVSVLGERFGKTDIRELRKSIGWVSSSLEARISPMQAAEDIVVSGKYASTGRYDNPTEADYEKAAHLMNELGCGHLAGRTYQTCSHGEKQRILIARALMASPKLLILDEPTTGLDFIVREEVLASVERLAEKGEVTILLVTHRIEEVLPVFSHALLLREGTVFDQGRREDVLNSSSLSEFFERDVKVSWNDNRAWMSLPSFAH